MIRSLLLLLILSGFVRGDVLPPVLEPPKPPIPHGLVLHIVDPGRHESARLILPADLMEPSLVAPLQPYEVPPLSPLLAGVALALAAVFFGFRVVGKQVPIPRLAFGAGLTLLLLVGFSGCGLLPRGDPVYTNYEAPAPLLVYEQGLEGEVCLERGMKDSTIWLLLPGERLRELPNP